MLEARKSKAFDSLFYRYNKHYLLQRHFQQVSFRGSLDPMELDRPILYMMNHSSWWDGLLAYHVLRTLSSGDHYFMMDERQLSRYRFFQKLGAFSIQKDSARGIIKSLDYASKLLDEDKRVWIYPQGDIYHADVRPLVFQPGIGYLLSRYPSPAVISVTMVSSLIRHQKPEISLWASNPLIEDWLGMGRKQSAVMLSAVMEQQLNEHKALVTQEQCDPSTGFIPTLRAGQNTSEVFDGFQRRLSRWKCFFKSF
ncbi:lysophospholipid acyltransferase family protein [Paenibacillus lemnae]|uniref:Phospholipid/glycerol acyltransferase domain-containing protein n=1 Tax=Paenibacillus lemnae TaxID=1330551 RepID=A0A848M8S9_PAELE|nr:lysophospholipid acyltransferase family protein [Paenibacillus lemnae]NMO97055.1 hypothetical protein [Paenibacillus lemnae]